MRKHPGTYFVARLMVLLGLVAWQLPSIWFQEASRAKPESVAIESRHVDIWSDGTRISGDLWRPKGLKAEDKCPVEPRPSYLDPAGTA
jgi:hypothetical protein